jgi:hypothetical protein
MYSLRLPRDLAAELVCRLREACEAGDGSSWEGTRWMGAPSGEAARVGRPVAVTDGRVSDDEGDAAWRRGEGETSCGNGGKR